MEDIRRIECLLALASFLLQMWKSSLVLVTSEPTCYSSDAKSIVLFLIWKEHLSSIYLILDTGWFAMLVDFSFDFKNRRHLSLKAVICFKAFVLKDMLFMV